MGYEQLSKLKLKHITSIKTQLSKYETSSINTHKIESIDTQKLLHAISEQVINM
jgi:hypothetical protein